MAGENESPTVPDAAVENSPSPEVGDLRSRSSYVSFVSFRALSTNVPEQELSQITRHYVIKGVLCTLVGVVAILFPLVFGLAVEQLLAWLLVFGGAAFLVQFLMVCGSAGTFPFLLVGALHFGVGLWLLLRPIEGLAAITFVLSGWFLVHGVLKLIMAFQMRHLTSWPAVVVSGIISIALGITIVVLTPIYGLQLLGIVFGADLLATGFSVLMISLIACLGHRTASDSEAAREPLLQGSGHAAPSA